MSAPSRYTKNKRPSTHYASFASPAAIGPTNPGDLHASGSDMGRPPLEYPPQILEIDPTSSTILPGSPTSAAWNLPAFTLHGINNISTYGTPNTARQAPLENYSRGTAQNNPLYSWYNENDGPWIPKSTISEISEERNPRGLQDNHLQSQHGHSYHQRIPSDLGTYPFGVPSSDSGYGTRRSDGGASVFSGDIPDRDQDGQSLAGAVAQFQQYPGMGERLEQRDLLLSHWTTLPDATIFDGQCGKELRCPTCLKHLKTRSELKKHDLRHRKPFKCDCPGCSRGEGFSTMNDLTRHKASKHPSTAQRSEGTKRYRCHVEGCKSKEKSWPRLDNFRSHLKRVHKKNLANDDEIDAMARQAEYVEPATTSVNHRHDFNQSIPLSGLVQAPSTALDSLPQSQILSTKWKGSYPSDTESPNHSIEPKELPFDDLGKDASLDELASTYEPSQRHTIRPSDISYSLEEVQGGRSLQGITPASVDLKEMQSKGSDSTMHPVSRSARLNPQGKVEVFRATALDAITEVIKATFSCSSSPAENSDHTVHRNPEWTLYNRKTSAERTWEPKPNSPITSTGSDISLEGSATSPESFIDAEAQSKALEVIKTLNQLGYIVQRDPSHSIRPPNPGSVASSKSENLVTCQICEKFTGRPCELKKHMKRHSRPYACTFSTCNNKTFGSKNDWKRHENSQHFHLESWRCDEEKPEGGICAKMCYHKEPFQDHLHDDHSISDNATIASKVEGCHFGHNGQGRFWCGFCVKPIDLKQKAMDAWAERFDHIDDHFMGRRGFRQQSIQDWVMIDSDDKPNLDVPPLHIVNAASRREISEDSSSRSPDSTSPNASSPKSTALAAPSSGDLAIITDSQGVPKRKRLTDDNGNTKPRKQRLRSSTVTLAVYCCQCRNRHNPKLDQNCTLCPDSHRFCDNCTVESGEPEDD